MVIDEVVLPDQLVLPVLVLLKNVLLAHVPYKLNWQWWYLYYSDAARCRCVGCWCMCYGSIRCLWLWGCYRMGYIYNGLCCFVMPGICIRYHNLYILLWSWIYIMCIDTMGARAPILTTYTQNRTFCLLVVIQQWLGTFIWINKLVTGIVMVHA